MLRLFLSIYTKGRYLKNIHPIKSTKLFVQKLVFIKFHFLIKMKTKVFLCTYTNTKEIFWNYDTICFVNLIQEFENLLLFITRGNSIYAH